MKRIERRERLFPIPTPTRPSNWWRRRGSVMGKGFTLTELMVAASLTALLGTIMLSSLSGFMTAWQREASRTEVIREGRAVMQFVGTEIDAAISEIGGKSSFVVQSGEDFQSLSFVTHVSPDAQPAEVNQSDVCAVSYFVAPMPGRKNMALFRKLTPSQAVFARLAGGVNVREPWPADGEPEPEVIAQNVISLKVRLLDAGMKEIDSSSGVPKFVEISLELIGGKQADAYFDPSGSGDLRSKIARENAQTFTGRYRL